MIVRSLAFFSAPCMVNNLVVKVHYGGWKPTHVRHSHGSGPGYAIGIAQVLTQMYKPISSRHSYGFRPGRNAHQALVECRSHITEGYVYAADVALEQFFDTVKHSRLIEVLSRTIKDGRVVSRIHKYPNAGVMTAFVRLGSL